MLAFSFIVDLIRVMLYNIGVEKRRRSKMYTLTIINSITNQTLNIIKHPDCTYLIYKLVTSRKRKNRKYFIENEETGEIVKYIFT